VENMPYKERLELFKTIEGMRGCPLISYVTNTRVNATGMMAPDVISHFIKQIQCIPNEMKKIDVLIVSNGGDPTVSWRLVSLLRERFDTISVLIPNAAFSAATLFALGADTIYMHPYANLGPVDPQLKFRKKDKDGLIQEEINYSAEDLRHFLDFVKNDVGISDQEQLEKSFEFICNDIGAIPIGITKRSTNLSYSMGEKLLKKHMSDQNKVKIIIEKLNSSFYHHGYPVGRTEAKDDIGLQIEESDDELDQLLWKIWEDYEKEMECDIPYNPLDIVLNSSEGSKLIQPIPQIDIPPNILGLPPPVQQAIMQQVIGQIIQKIKIQEISPIEKQLFIAALESSRCRSEFRLKESIQATRMPDTTIRVNRIPRTQGWIFYSSPT
jgi:hypothetical protein